MSVKLTPYNPEHIMLVQHAGENLVFLADGGKSGGIVFNIPSIDDEQAHLELEALSNSDFFFVYDAETKIAFNPDFINEVRYEDVPAEAPTPAAEGTPAESEVKKSDAAESKPAEKALTFYDRDNRIVERYSCPIDIAHSFMINAAKNGPYITVPGGLHILRSQAIITVAPSEDGRLSFVLKGGKVIVTDETFSPKSIQRNLENLLKANGLEPLMQEEEEVSEQNTVKLLDRNKVATAASVLNENIFGQDEAISAVSKALKICAAGMRKPNRPLFSAIFMGPTGVGKTELTKQLAQHLDMELLKLDMGEYTSEHDMSKLIGAAPGLVGFGETGKLTEPLKKNQKLVILFDEMEKAHPDIANVLLSATDDARVTDGEGKTYNLSECIIIITTNILPKDQTRSLANGLMSPEFIKAQQEKEKVDLRRDPNLLESFRSEMLNRINCVTLFKKLSPENILKIVSKITGTTNKTLESNNVNVVIELDEAARAYLAKRGFDDVLGARHMERAFEDHVNARIAEEIVEGALQEGGAAEVSFDPADKTESPEGSLRFKFTSATKETPAVETKPLEKSLLADAVPGHRKKSARVAEAGRVALAAAAIPPAHPGMS